MSRESGGRADKLGNRYEDYWSVELLLRLVDEKTGIFNYRTSRER